jgi:hypothetical protein
MPATVTVNGTTVQREEPVSDSGTAYSEEQILSITGWTQEFLDAVRTIRTTYGSQENYDKWIQHITAKIESATPDEKKAISSEIVSETKQMYDTYIEAHTGPGSVSSLFIKAGEILYKVGGGAVKTAMAVPDFLALLARTSTWVRVGEAILGVVALWYGVSLIAKEMGVNVPTPSGIARASVKAAT